MRIKSPLLIKAAGRLGYVLFSAFFMTVKKDRYVACADPYEWNGDQRHIFSLWHEHCIVANFVGRTRRAVALTSRHRDGSFVESILAPAGVKTVRGSTGRGGNQAARELIQVAATKDIVMVPDGPRGPRRTMSRGTVYLASRTGSPIVPIAYACDRYWEIKSSWTSHYIPHPFSRVIMCAGPVVEVPAEIGSDGLQVYQDRAQVAMDAIQQEAEDRIRQLPSRAPDTPSVTEAPRRAA